MIGMMINKRKGIALEIVWRMESGELIFIENQALELGLNNLIPAIYPENYDSYTSVNWLI